MARASRAVGPIFARGRGVPAAALDPELERGDALLGDADDADRRGHAGERLGRDRAALVDHEPGAYAAPARAPRPRATAAVPETSSLQPKESQTSWAGVKSCSRRVSTASQIATSSPLSSRVPRPQIAPSWISAPNGGCCQGAPSSTGTTSRWAISTTGRSALAPAQWKSRPWVSIRVRSSRSCSTGNCRSSSARNSSKAAASTRPGRGARRSGCGPGPGAWRDGPVRGWAITRGRVYPGRSVWDPRPWPGCGSLTGGRYTDGLAWCPHRPAMHDVRHRLARARGVGDPAAPVAGRAR